MFKSVFLRQFTQYSIPISLLRNVPKYNSSRLQYQFHFSECISEEGQMLLSQSPSSLHFRRRATCSPATSHWPGCWALSCGSRSSCVPGSVVMGQKAANKHRTGARAFSWLVLKPTHLWGCKGASVTNKIPELDLCHSFRMSYFVLKQNMCLILVQILEYNVRWLWGGLVPTQGACPLV